MISDADFKTIAMSKGALETGVADLQRRFDASGLDSASEFLDETKAGGEAAHCWPAPEPGEGIDVTLLEAACGEKPSLAGRAALLKAAGPDAYAKILAAWNCSPSTLAPGKNPKAADTGKAPEKKQRDHSNNPFHKSQWNVTKQGALIKTLGLDKANAIAKSVGSHVGATRPNADY
jgi:hypothetical protein